MLYQTRFLVTTLVAPDRCLLLKSRLELVEHQRSPQAVDSHLTVLPAVVMVGTIFATTALSANVIPFE